MVTASKAAPVVTGITDTFQEMTVQNLKEADMYANVCKFFEISDLFGMRRVSFLSSPLAVKQDIAAAIFVRCMCVCVCVCVSACGRPSGFVWTITSTFMHGFQNNLAQLLYLRRRSAI